MSIQVVLLAMGLFAVTFMSPGPNLLVVVQASVTQGRTAGFITGLGVAAGDALYAALGLLGMATMIAKGGTLFSVIKLAGGMYLMWFGLRMFLAGQRAARKRAGANSVAGRGAVTASGSALAPRHVLDAGTSGDPVDGAPAATPVSLFRRGLLTDLGNPQTALFFASVFSVVLTPATNWETKVGTWVGIVITSLAWRCVVSQAFSLPVVRRAYQRARLLLERITGLALAGFGVRLFYQGWQRT
ncbi:hypothetical protein WM40_16535 [Robbsia andropogonis]|uniref:Lysine transporter LysE n=1 Tax=Robbsia andropogonis TaxID=28092 RepID=A0A0F5JY67_9BURK|nr:LysE family transporter [Robbsia andropogonis]KKB62559.1 hypothetical protein WM40_16535 [Robbsia andropogonis]MCP1118458.1 LysE family transporter [Robbsia andropogonis]MCP1127762.1 LysE family transporter [Robbsia andropogonis]